MGQMLILFDPSFRVPFTEISAAEGFTVREVLNKVRPAAITRDPTDPLRFMLDRFGVLLGLCILAGHIEAL